MFDVSPESEGLDVGTDDEASEPLVACDELAISTSVDVLAFELDVAEAVLVLEFCETAVDVESDGFTFGWVPVCAVVTVDEVSLAAEVVAGGAVSVLDAVG